MKVLAADLLARLLTLGALAGFGGLLTITDETEGRVKERGCHGTLSRILVVVPCKLLSPFGTSCDVPGDCGYKRNGEVADSDNTQSGFSNPNSIRREQH